MSFYSSFLAVSFLLTLVPCLVCGEATRLTSEEGITATNQRSLQGTVHCPSSVTSWQRLVVLEVTVPNSACYSNINLLLDSAIIADLENAYVQTYNTMQASYCDPFVRQMTSAEIIAVGETNAVGNIPIEILVLGTCRGCDGLDMTVYDIPVTDIVNRRLQQGAAQQGTCTCPTVTSSDKVRAPYESEFITQFQQSVEDLGDDCLDSVATCGYGTTFENTFLLEVETAEGGELTGADLEEIAEAFKAASNAEFAVTQDSCNPDFRTFESVSITVEPPPSSGGRQLGGWGPMLSLYTRGTCSRCEAKISSGDKISTRSLSTEKRTRRSLQETWALSSCFCPLGSTVVTEAPPIQGLVDLLVIELEQLNVPVTEIVDLQELDGEVVN